MSSFITNQNPSHAAKSALFWEIEELRRMRGIEVTEHQIADLYATSVFLHACVNFWADAVSGTDWHVLENGKRVHKDHPLQILLSNIGDVMRRTEITRNMYGRNLIRKNRDLQARVYGLEWVNPLVYRPDVRMDGLIGFRVYPSRYHVEEAGYIDLGDSIYSTEIDFEDDFDGVAPAEVAFLQASGEVELGTTALAWFKNSLMMGGIFQPAQNENSSQYGADNVNGFIDLLKRMFQGSVNAGRTLVQTLRWEYTQLQQDFDKVAMAATYESMRQNVSLATGVPVEFITTGQSNYAELEGKIQLWYSLRLMPVLRRYADDFTRQLASEWGNEYTVVPDISRLQQVNNPTIQVDIVQKKLQASVLDLYSAQRELGNVSPDESLRGLYMVEGIPVPVVEMPNLWKLKYQAPASEQFAQAQLQQMQAASATPTTDGSDATEASKRVDDCIECEHDHHHDLPSIKAFEPIHDTPLDELRAWYKFSKSTKTREFEPVWLVGDIADSIRTAIDSKNQESIKAAFDSAFEHLGNAAKAIQATRLDFEGDFDELLSRARREKMGRVQWSSAMRSILRRYGTRAYIDGLRDGGVEDEPSDDDLITINRLISENSQYVTELGNVLYKEDGISDTLADGKAAMWYNKSISPFYDEGLVSADANGLYEWAYGDTEHCTDCQRLNGQRHRLKQWKARYMPQGDNLECKGFNCKCSLVKAKGRARGSF